MLPFGVTIPATVPQGSEIPEGLMNNPIYVYIYIYIYILPLHVSAYPGHSQRRKLFVIEGKIASELLAF
jgi:hypothetical protein